MPILLMLVPIFKRVSRSPGIIIMVAFLRAVNWLRVEVFFRNRAWLPNFW